MSPLTDHGSPHRLKSSNVLLSSAADHVSSHFLQGSRVPALEQHGQAVGFTAFSGLPCQLGRKLNLRRHSAPNQMTADSRQSPAAVSRSSSVGFCHVCENGRFLHTRRKEPQLKGLPCRGVWSLLLAGVYKLVTNDLQSAQNPERYLHEDNTALLILQLPASARRSSKQQHKALAVNLHLGVSKFNVSFRSDWSSCDTGPV